MTLYFNNRIIDDLVELRKAIGSIRNEQDEYKKIDLIDELLVLFYDKRLMSWLNEGKAEEKEIAKKLLSLHQEWENQGCNWTDTKAMASIYHVFALEKTNIIYKTEDLLDLDKLEIFRNGNEIDPKETIFFNNLFDINEKLTFKLHFKIKKSLNDLLSFEISFEGNSDINLNLNVDPSKGKNSSITIEKSINIYHKFNDSVPGSYKITIRSNGYLFKEINYEVYGAFEDRKGYKLPLHFVKIGPITDDKNNKSIITKSIITEDQDRVFVNKYFKVRFVTINYKFKVNIDNEFETKYKITFAKNSALSAELPVKIEKGSLDKEITIPLLIDVQKFYSKFDGEEIVSINCLNSPLKIYFFGNKYVFKVDNKTYSFFSYIHIDNLKNNYLNFILLNTIDVNTLQEIENYIQKLNFDFRNHFMYQIQTEELYQRYYSSLDEIPNSLEDASYPIFSSDSLMVYLVMHSGTIDIRLPSREELMSFCVLYKEMAVAHSEVTSEIGTSLLEKNLVFMHELLLGSAKFRPFFSILLHK